MRVCRDCKIEKNLEEFNFTKKALGKRQYYCRPCQAVRSQEYAQTHKAEGAARGRAYRLRNMRRAYEYLLLHPCVGCGESDPIVLEFDHIDPSTKTHGVAALLSMRIKWDRIHAEIEKCQVLCANCHRRRTAAQQDWQIRRWLLELE